MLNLFALYSVTALMKTCIAFIAIKHFVFIIAFSTKADFTVSLEQTFKFLYVSIFSFSLRLIHGHLLDNHDLHCSFKHLFSFVTVSHFDI